MPFVLAPRFIGRRGAVGWVEATGGTIATDGSYKVHTFTSSGNFEVTSVGPADGTHNVVEYMIIGGGGGGGGGQSVLSLIHI